MRMMIVWFVITILFCTGCGGAATARQGAALLATYTSTVQKQSEQFAAFREDLAKARLHSIGELEKSALVLEQGTESDLRGWRLIKDENRVEIYQGLRDWGAAMAQQAADMEALRANQKAAIDATKTAVNVRSKDLAAAQTVLAGLADPPNWQNEAAFYLNFVSEVSNNLQAQDCPAPPLNAAATTVPSVCQAKARADNALTGVKKVTENTTQGAGPELIAPLIKK